MRLEYLSSRHPLSTGGVYIYIYIYIHRYTTPPLGIFFWGPSGGVYAIHHILKLKKYDKIALVGFDNFEQGKQRYYFDLKYINPSLHYIIGRDITLDNKTIIKTLHSPEKTTDYFKSIFTEFPNIDFTMYSNINFNEKYNNVTIF